MELQNRIDFWKQKQEDIESQFKVLHQPIQTVKARKGRRKPQKEENRELSCYAGTLTKEFLTMVRFTFMVVGCVTGCTQLGATHLVGYLPSPIQRAPI